MEAAGAVKLWKFGGKMFLVHTSLRPSPIEGLGCFAEEPIRKGQVVWQFDSRLDLKIPLSTMHDFPQAIQAHFRTYTYVVEINGEEIMVYCADLSKHMNHSDTPNLMDTPDNLQEIALRDIEIGEELTCNYFASDLHAVEKLGR